MIKNIITTIFILILTSSSFAQTILLEEHVETDTTNENYGPNLKHYLFSYLKYGFILGEDNNTSPIKYGNSSEFEWGINYKYKLSNIFSSGFGVNYSVQSFLLSQNSQKSFPDTIQHLKERFSFNNIGGNVFARVNFDRNRGNLIGTYFEIGGYIQGVFLSKYYTKDNSSKNATSKYTEVIETKLKTTHKYTHGLVAKFGYKSVAIYAKYRLSDVFIERYDFPEFPRFILGVEVGAFN